MMSVWGARAEQARAAVVRRHLRRTVFTPRGRLATAGWPASRAEEFFVRWDARAQLQMMNLLVAAAVRRPDGDSAALALQLYRGYRGRHAGSLARIPLDEAVQAVIVMGRVRRHLGLPVADDHRTLVARLRVPARPDIGRRVEGGEADGVVSASRTAFMALALAGQGSLKRARGLVDMLDADFRLDDGLISSWLRLSGDDGPRRQHPVATSLDQAAYLLAETAVAARTFDDEDRAERVERIRRHLEVVRAELCDRSGVYVAETRGGREGLHAGVLMQAFAEIVRTLRRPDSPGVPPIRMFPAAAAAARQAADQIHVNAEAVWKGRVEVDGLPLFSSSWAETARVPRLTAGVVSAAGLPLRPIPERDLAVQLSGWAALESAASLPE